MKRIGYLTLTAKELAEKLGLPEGHEITEVATLPHAHNIFHIKVTGPCMPLTRDGAILMETRLTEWDPFK